MPGCGAPFAISLRLVLLKEEGDIAGAKQAWQAGIELGHGGAAFNLGVLLKDEGDIDALYNSGNALSGQARTKTGEEADQLFAAAGDKYAAALEAEPDSHDALCNWGVALSGQARTKTGEEADQLFAAAGEKYAAAESKSSGSASYNLACLAALLHDEPRAQEHLTRAKNVGTLPSREHLETDLDLESVRGTEWFAALLSELDD